MPQSSLLMIHQGALGDFILTLPAVIQLRKFFEPIDLLCHSQMGKLAGALNLADSWFSADASEVASLYSDQADPKITALLNRYDKIILFTISRQFENAIRRITTSFICQLPPKPPVDQRTHVSRFILRKLFGCGLITAAETELDHIRLAEHRGSRRDRNKILLHPGAGSIRKRWPLGNFLQVAAGLTEAGLNPEFILGPAEDDLATELEPSGRIIHKLEDLLELLNLFDSAGGYIGNDSGASHLAAFTGLPTTVIFGPADPARWKPVGPAVEVVRPGLDCLPCFETGAEDCRDQKCLEDISLETVVDAFNRVYTGF